MKKFIKVAMTTALALALMLGMALTALAAPSFTVTIDADTAVTDADGNSVEATIVESDATITDAQAKAITVAKGAADDQDTVNVLGIYDVTVPEGTVFPITLTFTINAKVEADKLTVYHYDADKEEWESESCRIKSVEASDTQTVVVAEFDKLSPVAIGYVTDGGAAPTTGDSNHVVLWGALMAVAALGTAGLIIFDRKRKAN